MTFRLHSALTSQILEPSSQGLIFSGTYDTDILKHVISRFEFLVGHPSTTDKKGSQLFLNL